MCNKEFLESYNGINIYKIQNDDNSLRWYHFEDGLFSETAYGILEMKRLINVFVSNKERIIEQEKSMSNNELYEEVLSLAGGDDYDGCFTDVGKLEYQYFKAKFEERLGDFLSK